MSKSPTARTSNSEIGDRRHDLIGQSPLLNYLRYEIDLNRETLLDQLVLDLSAAEVAPLSEINDPHNMARLKLIGDLVSQKKVYGRDCLGVFDITHDKE